MTQKNINTLIIDDHPLIIEAYKTALSEIENQFNEYKFFINQATCCDTAVEVLKRYSKNITLNLVFLDIMLPPSKNKNLISGEDIGLEIRSQHPKAKIVVATTFNDNYRIQSIFKSINPDGFIIKSDIASQTLVSALHDVLTNPPYYSKTVLQSVRKFISHDYLLDKWDRFLLYELSRGTKMKEMPTLIPFSLGALEKRKRQLKLTFNVQNGEDRELLSQARKHGFI